MIIFKMKYILNFLFLTLCSTTLAQVSQSPNITLNSVLLNPAFAGSKNKNRISIQNSETLLRHSYYKREPNSIIDIGKTITNTLHCISYDGIIRPLKIGIGFNCFTMKNLDVNNYYNLLKSNNGSNYNESNELYEGNNVNYKINSLGMFLNKKINLKIKEDSNASTLTIGLGISVVHFKETIYRMEGNYILRDTNYSFYRKIAEGTNTYIKPFKITAGLLYNIQNGYIGTTLQSNQIGYNYKTFNWGVMGGYSFQKKITNPIFSFTPQAYLNLSLHNEYDYKNQALNYKLDTLNFLVLGSKEPLNGLSKSQNSYLPFKGINYALNLDFRYKKVVAGIAASNFSSGFMLGFSYANLKVAINYSYLRRKAVINNGNDNTTRNISLSTNILF
jgi:hypothetical protein